MEALSRSLLPNAFDPCADRALSRGGQEKLRTHVAVRQSRYFVDLADIMVLTGLKRGNSNVCPAGEIDVALDGRAIGVILR